MIDAVEAYAPGFKASVIARKILTPLDLERDFGLVGGDIFHGACRSTSSIRRGPRSATPTIARPSPASTCAARRPIRAAG